MRIRSKLRVKLCLVLSGIFLFLLISLFSDPRPVSVPIAAAATGNAQRSGATIYSQICSRCHGSDGKARTAKGRSVGATDLTSSDWTPDVARDTRIVTRGKEEMPAFKGKLKPAEIDAVVQYIRRFKN